MSSTRAALALVAAALVAGAASPASGTGGGRPKGAQLYRMHCELCHGADGRLGLNGAKDLSATALNRAEMIAQVTEGKGLMMPYRTVLTAREIEAVVDYARKLGPAR